MFTVSVALSAALVAGVSLTTTPTQPSASAADAPVKQSAKVSAKTAGKPYTFLMKQSDGSGEPVRWNPCEEITWSWKNGRKDDVKYMSTAFRRVSDATFMKFRKVSSGADIVVYYKKLPPGTLGIGGFTSDGYTKSRAVSGSVQISKEFKNPRVPATLHIATFTHELGHVFGLGHVKSKSELMYPVMGKRTTFGSGDLEGLRKLGVMVGCINKPTATPVTMSTTTRQVDYSWWDPENGPAPVEFEKVATVSWTTMLSSNVDRVEIYDPATDEYWSESAQSQPDGTTRAEFSVPDTWQCTPDLEVYVYFNDPYYGIVEARAPMSCSAA